MSVRLVSIASLTLLTITIAACSTSSEEQIASSANEVCANSCTGGSLRGDSLLALVDRENGLRADWSPHVIELPENTASGANRSLRPDAREAFIQMVKDAYYNAGLDLYCGSGYRSFDVQCSVFNNEHAPRLGCAGANRVSAHAGHSEHQLGTVCDISFVRYLGTADPFVKAGDDADLWLQEHAHEYGFANSYPSPNTDENDGYIHEPWHYRYIGVAAAAELRRRGRIAVPRCIRSLSPEERAALEGGQSIGGGGGTEQPPPGGGDCGSVTLLGYCDKNTIVYCKDGLLKSKDCTESGNVCNFVSPSHGHDCVPKTPCPEDLSFNGRCDGNTLSWCADGALRTLECAARVATNTCKLESEETGYNCLP